MSEFTRKEMAEACRDAIRMVMPPRCTASTKNCVADMRRQGALESAAAHLETEQSRIDAAVDAEFERCCKLQCGDCEHGVAGYEDPYAGWCHKTSHGLVNCRANLLRKRKGAKP